MVSEIRILHHLLYDTVIQEEIVVGELEWGILYQIVCLLSLYLRVMIQKAGIPSWANWYNDIGETCFIAKLSRDQATPSDFHVTQRSLCQAIT